MTSVNITTNKNTVTVNGETSVVTVATEGPQGAGFTSTGASLDDSAKIDKSVVYYDQSASAFKADSTWTTSTLSDGGNF